MQRVKISVKHFSKWIIVVQYKYIRKEIALSNLEFFLGIRFHLDNLNKSSALFSRNNEALTFILCWTNSVDNKSILFVLFSRENALFFYPTYS